MHQNTAIDFRAMAKGIRAGGIAIGMEAARLAECGENDRAEELNKAASSLGELASQLEAWRLHRAEALRQLSLSMAKLNACLKDPGLHSELGMPASGRELFNDAARLAESAALGCAEIALQLDPSVTEGVSAHVH